VVRIGHLLLRVVLVVVERNDDEGGRFDGV
jgi:hypothetical protein